MKADNSDDSVTRLLHRWRDGDGHALEALLPLVYSDMRRIAAGILHSHAGHTTLQTTALLHDVLLKLLDRPAADFDDAAHLLNASARMMRQTLVDRARAAQTEKRGGGWQRDNFTSALELPIPDGTDLNALDQALTELESFDERMARVVELRYFVGLGMAEVGAVLGVTERTARRDWVGACAWLKDRLDG